jgi:hypothetical protein
MSDEYASEIRDAHGRAAERWNAPAVESVSPPHTVDTVKRVPGCGTCGKPVAWNGLTYTWNHVDPALNP